MVAALTAFAAAAGDLALSPIFSDHAVLQRGKPIAVFGTAPAGSGVKIMLDGATVGTRAGDDGRFVGYLPVMEAGGPFILRVESGSEVIELNDIMVGEVWICSGQSNMWWTVERNTDAQEILKSVENSQIRLFNIPQALATTPQDNFGSALSIHGESARPFYSNWQLSRADATKYFSSVGYFFAHHISAELGVPVGIINASWSAASIEPWISSEWCIHEDSVMPANKRELVKVRTNAAYRKQKFEDYAVAWNKWHVQRRSGDYTVKPPEYPAALAAPAEFHDPAAMFNAMINPFVPYTFNGMLWYQGEANQWDRGVYDKLMNQLACSWREAFKNHSMPIYFIQLGSYKYGHADHILPETWEAQQRFADFDPLAQMAVITDVSTIGDIHPPDKRVPALRLANLALKYSFGRADVKADFPRLLEYKTVGNSIVMTFKNTDALAVRDGGTAVFEIAGENGAFMICDRMDIKGNTVTVSAANVKKPCMVRYGWSQVAEATLVDAETKLPLGAFRAGSVPERVGADANVPKLKDYTLLYRLTPGASVIANNACVYDVDNSAKWIGVIKRVAYYMELVKKDGSSDYIALEMDAFTQDVKLLGLPTVKSGAFHQIMVNNVNVYSNVKGVETGSFDECNAELWGTNYGTENSAGIFGASDKKYDFGDAPQGKDPGYGSFQFHNYKLHQTLLAFNAWSNAATSDVGIGNNPAEEGHSDWTFAKNAGDYARVNLLIFAK